MGNRARALRCRGDWPCRNDWPVSALPRAYADITAFIFRQHLMRNRLNAIKGGHRGRPALVLPCSRPPAASDRR